MEYQNLATFTKYTEAETFMKENDENNDKENETQTQNASTIKDAPQWWSY